MATDHLKALHTALIDTKNGYEEAVKDADQSDAARMFRDMLSLHSRDHEEVHALLVAAGDAPDESGSFMSTIHETVIKVRSAVTGLGTNAMSAFVSGEEMLVSKYDEALTEASGDQHRQSILQRQKMALSENINRMKAVST